MFVHFQPRRIQSGEPANSIPAPAGCPLAVAVESAPERDPDHICRADRLAMVVLSAVRCSRRLTRRMTGRGSRPLRQFARDRKGRCRCVQILFSRPLHKSQIASNFASSQPRQRAPFTGQTRGCRTPSTKFCFAATNPILKPKDQMGSPSAIRVTQSFTGSDHGGHTTPAVPWLAVP